MNIPDTRRFISRTKELTLQLQLDSCRHEAAVTARLLRNSCGQLRRQLSERDRELERLRALLQLHGIKPPP